MDDYLSDVEQVVDYKVENFLNDMNPRPHANVIGGEFILSIYEECTLESVEYGIKWFLLQNQFSGILEKDYISTQGFLMKQNDDGEEKQIPLKREQVIFIKGLLPKSNLIAKSDFVGYIAQMSALFDNIYKVSAEKGVSWYKYEDVTNRYICGAWLDYASI